MNETIDINPKKQLLTVQNLNLTRGTFQLKDISFSVYSNEILAIIGKPVPEKHFYWKVLQDFRNWILVRFCCGNIL